MTFRDYGGEFKFLEQLILKAIAESQVELYSIQLALRCLSKNKLFLNQKMVLMKSSMLFLKNGLWMKHKFFNIQD